MPDYTLIKLDEGVLSFHVEGVIDQAQWRRLIAVGVTWLVAQGGGSFVLPHTLS